MQKPTLDDVRADVARGESQRLEFKGDAPLDGAYKNTLCREIAAMANGGGGRLILGVRDGNPAEVLGLPLDTARALSQAGYMQKLLAERMVPQPEVEVSAVAVDQDHMVIVIDVTAPWVGANPRFMPVILTKDVQDQKGRVVAAAGAILVRDHDQCARVMSYQQWDRVMQPVLDRFREAEIRPMLQALLHQRYLDQTTPRHRGHSLDAAFEDVTGRLARLQAVNPQAALYDCRLVLDGATLSRAQQHELIDQCSVPRRGWPVPPYVSALVGVAERGALTFSHPVAHRPVPPRGEIIHEFWLLSPDGHFISAFLDRVDLDASLHGLPPPGPDRALDPIELTEQVLGFLKFASNAARYAKVKTLWVSVSLRNVLERPVGKRLNPDDAIVDRIRRWPLGWPVSNKAEHTCEGEFDTEALVAGWRDVAVQWNQRLFAGFGWEVDDDTLRRLHGRLLGQGAR